MVAGLAFMVVVIALAVPGLMVQLFELSPVVQAKPARSAGEPALSEP
jgi:hypothetical protein